MARSNNSGMNLFSSSLPWRFQLKVDASTTSVPDDLVIDVLSCLPVKSVIRFSCLSKLYNSLVSEPSFVKKQLIRSSRNVDLTHVYATDDRSATFTVFRLLENPPVINNLPHDPYYQLTDKNCHYIVGSCNGLLCLYGSSYTNRKTWLRIWNPATRTISEKLESGCDELIGIPINMTFGYDYLRGTYKVVYFVPNSSNVRVFSLNDNIWRNTQDSPEEAPHDYAMDLVHLSGSVNWLAIRHYPAPAYNCNNITIEQFMIISFDMGTETHARLSLPQGFKEVPYYEPNLRVLKNCLCFSHDFKRTHFLVWQMKEFGVKESWIQLFKIDYHNLQMDDHFNLVFHLLPLCLSEKSDTLLLINIFGMRAILYNWRDDRAEKIHQPRFINNILHKYKYVQSLVWYR
ncbi:F-box/kelch-repeat protein [Trifolium repens]|nr:F-box/kelch-repeat protein [Trifolium repens]